MCIATFTLGFLQSLCETWQSFVGPLPNTLDNHACEIVLADTSTVLVPRCQVFLADSNLGEAGPPTVARQRRALRNRSHLVANSVGSHQLQQPLTISPQLRNAHRRTALTTVTLRAAPTKIFGQ